MLLSIKKCLFILFFTNYFFSVNSIRSFDHSLEDKDQLVSVMQRNKEAKPCQVPHIVHGVVTFTNGTKTPSKVAPGVKVLVKCDTGRVVRRGSSQSICLRRGDWLHRFGMCSPSNNLRKYCPLPVIDNGELFAENGDYLTTASNGTTIMLVCKSGHFIMGPGSSTCLEDGKWANAIGECKRRAPEISAIDNKVLHHRTAKLAPTNNVTSMEESTSDNNETTTAAQLIAAVAGAFSPSRAIFKLSTVVETDLPDPSEEHYSSTEATMTTLDEFNLTNKSTTAAVPTTTTITSSTAPQVEKSNVTESVSDKDGSVLPVANCPPVERPISCPLPLMPHGTFYGNGSTLHDNFVWPNTKVTFVCDAGYVVPHGMDSSVCQSDGKWSNYVEACLKLCDDSLLPSVENGVFLPSNIRGPGEQLFLKCHEGYTLLGPESVVCVTNGSWTEPGSCVKQCKETPEIANGFVSEGNSTVGAKRHIGCNLGYMLKSADGVIICDGNGEWEVRSDAACILIDVCGQRPHIVNGGYEKNATEIWPLGSVHRIKCDGNHELFGSETVTCNGLNSWTSPGSCVLPNCGDVPVIKDGYMKMIPSRNKATTYKIICNHGFILFGAEQVHCIKATHQWSPLGVCLLACAFAGNVWPKNDSLIAFWPLDDQHQLTDIGPHQYNLDNEYGMLTSDIDGPFAGTSYTVKSNNKHIGSSGFLRRARSFTISFYYFTASHSNSSILMFHDNDLNEPQLSLRYVMPTSLEIRTGNGLPAGNLVGIFEDVFVRDKWNFVAITYDNHNRKMALYGRNGPLMPARKISVETLIKGWDLHHWFYIGKAPNATHCCSGLSKSDVLACVMLYDVPLAPKDIFGLQQACRCQRLPF